MRLASISRSSESDFVTFESRKSRYDCFGSGRFTQTDCHGELENVSCKTRQCEARGTRETSDEKKRSRRIQVAYGSGQHS